MPPFKVMMPGASPTPMPQNAPETPDESEDSGEGDSAIDQDDVGLPKLEPGPAGYLGPEHGPFMCSNCVYFEDPRSCHIVSGDIDPNGCCNLIVSKIKTTSPVDQDDSESYDKDLQNM